MLKKTYPLDMTPEDVDAFQKDLGNFLKEKLGNRAYVCIVGYQFKAADQTDMYQFAALGLDNPVSMWHTINCLKWVGQQVQDISVKIGAPVQQLTPDNNPLIKQKPQPPAKTP